MYLLEALTSGLEVYTSESSLFLCTIKHRLTHASSELELDYEEELSCTSSHEI